MKNTESIKNFLKKSGEPETFIILTNKGCSYNGTAQEILALITCLVNELKDDVPKEAFKKTVDLAFKLDEMVSKYTDKEVKEMDKELEDLEKKIKKIENLIKEL